MSLHQNFSHAAHPGFARSVDPSSARRQFQVSMGVVVVLAAAICGSAVAIRPTDGFDTASQRSTISAAAAVNRTGASADLRTVHSNGG